MYRAITWKALVNTVPLDQDQILARLARKSKIEFAQSLPGAEQKIYCDGEDITEAIRHPRVSSQVSQVAAHLPVRKELLKAQRFLASQGGVVMDGRDIGTFVLPNAPFKFFLTASLATRSKRRFLELKTKGIEVILEEVEKEIKQRDFLDENRDCAPLVAAPDAEIIDTTALTVEEVVAKIANRYLGRA